MITGIVAFCKGRGIAYNNGLPWDIKEDLTFFKNMTINSMVIMGMKTFESLNNKPLKDRLNVVLTNQQLSNDTHSNLIYTSFDNIDNIIQQYAFKYPNIFVIGGESVYKQLYDRMDQLMVTYIDKTIRCDRFFPEITNEFTLVANTNKQWSDSEKCFYQHLRYRRATREHEKQSYDQTYFRLVKRVLDHDTLRSNRTDVETLSVFGDNIEFDLSNNHVPLLTTKRVALKSCIEELLWFMRGDTDANILKKRNVRIWDGNSSRQFLDTVGLNHLEEGDCGANYSFQWRYQGQEYKNCKTPYKKNTKGDQIQNIIHLLKNNPTSRRILLSAWNPSDLNKTVLPPCHVSAQFYVDKDNGLSCHMYQRSCDVFLGLPFNIFSYTVLTHILAKKANLKPRKLVISLGDVHIYANHIEQMKEQLSRQPLTSAKLIVNDSIKDKEIEDIVVDDFEVVGYFPHSAIKGDMVV